MELLSFLLMCAVLALSKSLNATINKKGEIWIIRSNTIADEFNTLDVQKLDKSPTRSNIAEISNEKTKSRSKVKNLGLVNKNLIHSAEALKYKEESSDGDLLNQTPKTKKSEQGILPKGMNGDGFTVKDVASDKKEQKVDAKRAKVRQEIEPNPEVYPGGNIGKPYGDPDGYQTIGDGIFLMSTEQEAALSPKSTGSNTRNLDTFIANSNGISELIAGKEKENAYSKSLPEPSKENLPDILTDLDKNSAKKKKNGTQHAQGYFSDKRNATIINEESSEKNEATEKANSRNSESMDSKIDWGEQLETGGGEHSNGLEKVSSSEGVAGSEPAADLDAMTPTEMKALQSFQNKLGQEDKVIGKLMLAKKVDKGQLEFIEKTNAMLRNETQKQIDNVMEKYKNEESNFIKKNPYVVNKPKLLEKIKNTTYQDVTATKRGFLAINDNLRVENVYNSLLKEDDMISKGLNEKAEVRKAILRHKGNPEDEQVSKFLDFLEEEDKHTENGDVDVKPMKKTKEKKINLQNSNLRLLVLEPSLGALSDKFTADGTPQLTEKELAHMLGDVSPKSKKVKKLKAALRKMVGEKRKVRKEPVMKALQDDLTSVMKERGRKLKTKAKRKKIKSETQKGVNWRISGAKKTFPDDSESHYTQIKVMEINARKNSNRNSEKPVSLNKTGYGMNKSISNAQKSEREQDHVKQKGNRQQDIHKKISYTNSRRISNNRKIIRKTARYRKVQKNSNMKEGDMTNHLYVSAKAKNKKQKSKDKEYYWHGTVKPETRQLPTNPTEQIRKFGRISNILPVSFEPAAPEGIGQVIGDSNNIASLGTATKETTGLEDTDSETDTSDTYESNADHFHKLGLNKIDENAISSTSFFSASKPKHDEYNQVLKQGIDPMAQKYVNSAMKEINDKDFEKVAGIVDKDSSKVVSMFDPNTPKPKLEEFTGSEHEGEKENINEEYDDRTNKHQNGNKKHKLKIVLHLPEKMDGNIQEIHGEDSEMQIGTIKGLTMQYTKTDQKPSLGQELADDDEDTLEGILSKPTAKLEEFHPQATSPSVEYVPETVQGKESNEWNKKGSEDEEETSDEEARERNDSDYIDNVKSNKLLSMIKHSEELLQKELGRHENREEKTERFVSKANDDEDEDNDSVNHHEHGESKSITSKKKPHLKNTKKKKKTDKEVENFTYNSEPSISPNIYADQINYEQKSREVSQQIPIDTIDKIHQIFNADQHLMPFSTSKLLLDDKQALEKPGSGPLAANHRKKLLKANKSKKLGSKVSASTDSMNGQVNPPGINWGLLKHKQLWNLVPETHNLHIEGGKIHGGTINGGFISGGDIEGGDIEGGVITGGKILGGVFRDGRMENGVLKNGTVEGGVIQGGNISGGKIRAGLVAGGKLKGGEVNGGKLSGGEVDGGVLKSGEIRGGLLISGSVEGGLLKGGTIEGGHLLGGVMLGGKLKGGIVKSGVIKGGTIEGGVVDGGVIEDGVVIKGGVVRGTFPRNTTVVLDENKKNETDDEDELTDKKIEEDLLNFSSSPSERVTLMKPTTTQMYKLKVDAPSQDHYAEPAQQISSAKAPDEQIAKPSDSGDPINISTLGAPESWPVENKHKAGKQTDSNKHKVASVSYSNTEEQKQKVAMDKPTTYKGGSNNKVKAFSKVSGNKDGFRYADKEDEFQQLAKDSENADQKSLMMRSPTPMPWIRNMASSILKNYGTTTRATIDPRPAVAKYHWSLNSVRGGKIIGSPGKSMSVIGGIKVHNGVATFNDGIDRGYIDAGDFQGECISDPDVCKKGLSLSLTSKIYKDSAESPTRMYLFDSGAGSEDSRGMALWVNKGKIEGAVSTRKGTWCLEEDLDKFTDRWVDYVLTWHPTKGLYLYANCELMAISGFGRGCDVCTRSHCHQIDQNTHLMFGRPNKGPHFKLTHFSAGDITIYEDFFNTEAVTQLCGSNNDYLKVQKVAPQRLVSNVPLKSPLDLSSYVMKKQQLTTKTSEFVVPTTDKDTNITDKEFEVWPTPSGLHLLSALFSTAPAAKPIQRESLKVDGGYSDWSSWTSCIGACGGTSMATRYCNNPVPKNGGRDCSSLGPARRTRQCDESNCFDPENVKAIARFEQSESADIENDISKRKSISRVSTIDQQKDINELKEEMSVMKHR